MYAKLCEAIIKNQKTIYTVGIMPEGWNGINDEVFFSIPAIIGEGGITHIVNMKLDPVEHKKVADSAKVLRKIIDGIKL